jgi:type I restriction enzyme, S subunit
VTAWTPSRLGNLIKTQKGFAFKSSWFGLQGRPVVKVSNFTADSVSCESLVFLADDVAAEHEKYALCNGDVLIQTVGSWPNNPASVVGKVVRVPKRLKGAFLNQKAVRIIPGPLMNETFLFYLLRDKRFGSYIVGAAQGAANQAAITLESIRAFSFALPPIATQSRIASILCAYDDLIENNTQRIAILEEMARWIYEEWFVRFRFPGHESVRMVKSELGAVPEGWDVVSASSAIHINPTTKVPKEGLKPFVAMNCLSNTSMLVEAPEERSGNSGSKFRNGDTLFARITPCLENGKTGFVQFLPTDEATAFGSTEFIVLRSRTLTAELVYLIARSARFRDNAIKSMSGASGRQRVREACFDTFQLVQPDPTRLASFVEVVRPMFRLVHALARKNSNLRATRDLLLPKLISGKLDVSSLPELEAAVA